MPKSDVSVADEVVVGNDNHCHTINEFYKNRNILITGATGFVGKVLLEKLLRSCDDIGTIYVVIRQKKGKTTSERLKELLSLPVFGRMHKKRPHASNKVVAIEGDISEACFKLNERDQKLIEDVVSIVFHSAATVKFDEEMKYAVNMNIRGTKHMIDLAKKIKNLKAFVYVSTAYSNSDRRVVEEEYYTPRAPKHFWKDLITAAEKMDENELNALTPSLIGNLPNTYTFTKQITESLVYDNKDQIPLVIYRPSIVAGAFREPFPGWVDNLNGPTGLALGFYTGALNVLLSDPESRQDYVGVDYVVNGLIAAAWKRGRSCNDGNCLVYTAASGKYSKTNKFIIKEISLAADKVPAEKCMWKPKMTLTTNLFRYNVAFFLLHLVPALLVDIGLKASGIKFRLFKAYRKIYVMSLLLRFFSLTTIDFKHEKLLGLHAELTSEDKKTFNFDISSVSGNERSVVEACMVGVKTYILKEDTSTEVVEKLKKRLKYYVWADVAVKAFWLIVFLRFLFQMTF